MASELARKAAELASRDVGERETDGPNNSPRIRVYGKTVKIKPPAKYCAAAVCTWILEASRELLIKLRMRFSARALGLAENNPTLRHDPHVLEPEMIPCIGCIDTGEPGGDGHTFLIVGMSDNGQLQTIEANSNGAGARDGQGVYALNIRKVQDLKWIVEIA